MSEILAPELTWTGQRFESDVAVEVDDRGRIVGVGPRDMRPVRPLENRALLPGFVNAHSHAFQRALRGRGERFPSGEGSFWTWREAMYELVGSMDADRLFDHCRQAFGEMLRAGITSVGEFHYLHHEASGRGYALDQVVLEAAREVGIRLALLNTYYRTGGVQRPVTPAQKRFETVSPEAYWERMDALQGSLDPDSQSLGAVVHSIRAADLDEIRALHAEARARGLVFHMHVEEQQQEVLDCKQAYGKAPMALFLEQLEIDEGFTAVHCTFTDKEDLAAFVSRGGIVCLCPLTEANLADGVADLPRILAGRGRVSLGTDSNARISMLEEVRWLEYVQRLRRGKRGVVRDAQGRIGPNLLRCATEHGARSLGIEAGAISPGAWADFVTIDLESPQLEGFHSDTLLESLFLGAGRESLAEVCVGGRWRDLREPVS